MLKRLLVGLVLGLVMGSLVATVAIMGLHMTVLSSIFAYLFAAVTGIVTGLVAGKPIWAAGGQIEAGLKAGFGALLSVGMMYALRHWVHINVDLGDAVSAYVGSGQMNQHAAFSLPIIGGVLGAFYSADNTPSSGDADAGKSTKGQSAAAGGKKAPAGQKTRVAAAEDDELDADSEAAPPKRAKR
jgi:hypothetical protein